MRLGYLHLGPPRYGLSRYGRLLAEEARRQSHEVVESTLELTGDWRTDRTALAEASRHLADTDLVHVQYSNLVQRSVWGGGWRRLLNLSVFLRHIRAPFVVTIHDSYALPIGRVWRRSVPDVLALRRLLRGAHSCFVSSAEERSRLLQWVSSSRIEVIPHFVETRAMAVDAASAKRKLGLSGLKVVTLLGFIHNRKGYRLLLDALPHLPPDVVVVFAGEPLGGADAVRKVHDLVARNSARVRMTGYLSEEDLDEYLASTDVAVCPFRHMSASGSLATWLSARRPILASDLPQIAEYNDIEPGAIATFTPYTPAGIASGISELLRQDRAERTTAVSRLGEALSLPLMFKRHMIAYMAGARPSRRRARKTLAVASE